MFQTAFQIISFHLPSISWIDSELLVYSHLIACWIVLRFKQDFQVDHIQLERVLHNS